ncbi:MAG TPA: hypothetical protein VGJ91_01370 [Polyangiaceae bacterium]
MLTRTELMMEITCEQSKVMFVALECGGQWPVNLRANAGTDLIVVAQGVGEDLLAFARRFLGKVLSLVARGAEVTSSVLAVAPVFDLRHLEARCAIARALLRAFRLGSHSALYLVEPEKAAIDCRPHLLALAEGLAENAATDYRVHVGYDSFSHLGRTRSEPHSNVLFGGW